MDFTKNLDEQPFSFRELVQIVQGKTVVSLGDMGHAFELGLSDDYMLRITGDRVNIVRTKNPPEQWTI